jgi:transposase-like protein
MRYRAAEKLEIIRLLEQSSLPVRRTLALGISHATFYRWYQRYREGAGTNHQPSLHPAQGRRVLCPAHHRS